MRSFPVIALVAAAAYSGGFFTHRLLPAKPDPTAIAEQERQEADAQAAREAADANRVAILRAEMRHKNALGEESVHKGMRLGLDTEKDSLRYFREAMAIGKEIEKITGKPERVE